MTPATPGTSVAVVGLGFGAEFLPIYLSHPDVERVAICDSDEQRLRTVGDRYRIEDRYTTLDGVLADERYDAVHLLTPVAHHAAQTLRVLRSGRHCACAVPMATSLDDLAAIIAAQRESGRVYMMMETSVYGREYLHVRDRYARGELGPLTFLRGVHVQDLVGFPEYWWGFPPMHYVTHALSPLLALSGARVRTVHCLGSGRLPGHLVRDHDNPYPLETALFRLDRDDLAAEVTMAFFQTARAYQEGFSVYGQRMGFEWEQLAGEGPAEFVLHEVQPGRRGRSGTGVRIEPADRADLLPPEIARFSTTSEYDPGTGPLTVGAHHGGSHPHLVHEFVTSIVRGRVPAVDAVTAARWTAPGICAHASALRDGEAVPVPTFDLT
ncbi:MAG: Gfo/Idh/MocA family oxidoreductase [Actinocatenispora sp.]